MEAQLIVRRHFKYNGNVIVAFETRGMKEGDPYPQEAPLANARQVLRLFESRVPPDQIQRAKRQIAAYERGVCLWVDTKGSSPVLILEERGKEPVKEEIRQGDIESALWRMSGPRRGILNDVPPEDIEAVRGVRLASKINGRATQPGMPNNAAKTYGFFG